MVLIRRALIASLIAVSASTARAQWIDRSTIFQATSPVEIDIVNILKAVQTRQNAYRAEMGRFAFTLTELNYSVPVHMREYGTLRLGNSSPDMFFVEFLVHPEMQNRGGLSLYNTYRADRFRIFNGPRFSSVSEARREIVALVNGVQTSQRAHLAEFGVPTTNPDTLGLLPNFHYYDLGLLSVQLLPPTFNSTTGLPEHRWTITFVPAEIGRQEVDAKGTYSGFLDGLALSRNQQGQVCILRHAVRIPGVTNYVYSVDQTGRLRTVIPYPYCPF